MKRLHWIGFAGALAAALLLAAPLAAGPVAIPGGNLVQNPGAENGPSAKFDTVVPPTGWETTGAASAWAYFTSGQSAPDRPGNDVAAAIGGGTAFFSGGVDASVSTASQTIDVSAAATEIDAHSVAATLAAYLGGYGGSPDTARIDARFLGATGNALGSVGIGPVTREDRGNRTTLLKRSATKPVPLGTRSIAVVMTMTMTDRPKNQGFVDNVSLTLAKASAGGGQKATLTARCSGKTLVATVKPAAGQKVKRVTFTASGRKVVDRKAPFTARFPAKGLPAQILVKAQVASDGPAQSLSKKVKRC